IEAPGMRYEEGTVMVSPGSGGGHNWQPMAYSPETQLVYIPGSNNSRAYTSTPEFTPIPGRQITGVEMNDFAAGLRPEGARISSQGSFVKAWDPVTQQARWEAEYPGFGGGILATGGNLVFVPRSNGVLVAHNAETGEV